MPWQLEIEQGPRSQQIVELTTGVTVTFGRASGAMQTFPDDSMSAMHFTISLTAGMARLQNLSKTTPTQVNGAAVDTAMLQPGDRIQAGQTSFVVRGPAASPFRAQVRLGG